MSQRSGGATSEKPERPGRGDNRDGRRAAAPRNHRAPRWAKTQAGPERDAIWQLDAETGIGSSTTAPVPRVLSGRNRAHAPALEIHLLPQETDIGPACPLRCAESAAKTALERVEANDTAIESLPTSSPDGAMIGSHAKQNRGACVSTGRSGFALRSAHSAASVDGARQDTIGSFPWPVLPLLPFRTRHPGRRRTTASSSPSAA